MSTPAELKDLLLLKIIKGGGKNIHLDPNLVFGLVIGSMVFFIISLLILIFFIYINMQRNYNERYVNYYPQQPYITHNYPQKELFSNYPRQYMLEPYNTICPHITYY